MSDREAHRALDQTHAYVAELSRLLEEAMNRANELGAADIAEHLAEAKAASGRGMELLNQLRTCLEEPVSTDAESGSQAHNRDPIRH